MFQEIAKLCAALLMASTQFTSLSKLKSFILFFRQVNCVYFILAVSGFKGIKMW
jgi:hypothetical protein